MPQSNNHTRKENRKTRKGDTARTSNRGQKLSSGGTTETDNQGHPNEDNPQNRGDKRIDSRGRKV